MSKMRNRGTTALEPMSERMETYVSKPEAFDGQEKTIVIPRGMQERSSRWLQILVGEKRDLCS
jgi:hypothetical protein